MTDTQLQALPKHPGEVLQLPLRNIADLCLCITCENAALAVSVERLLDTAFLWDAPDSGSRPASLHLQFFTAEATGEIRDAARVSTDRVRVDAGLANVRLSFGYAYADIDAACGSGRISLSPQYWRLPLKLQQEVVLLVLLWLVQVKKRFALHASAVVGSAGVVLFAGASGSGKSTTALSLVRSGWASLADDVVVYQLRDNDARFWGLPRGFSFSPETLERDPVLKQVTQGTRSPVGEKLFALFERVSPSNCSDRLSALIFPTITGAPHSRLQKLDPTDAVASLVAVSAGITVGGQPQIARDQLGSLTRLAAQAPSFRLEAGTDIFCNGAELIRLLATHQLAMERT